MKKTAMLLCLSLWFSAHCLRWQQENNQRL